MAICIKSGEKIFFICPFFLLTKVGYYDKICSTLPIYFVMGKFLKKEGIVIKTEKEDQRQTDSDLAQRKPPCGARFSMLSRAFKRRIDERVGQMGLTAVQCDVLGNLHRLCLTRQEVLQKDLEKMSRVVEREYPDADFLKLLVLDATTGQNALSQAKTFDDAVGLDGLIITKLDGTAKGGFVFSLADELSLPVLYAGVGEKIGDLEKFDSAAFVDAIL